MATVTSFVGATLICVCLGGTEASGHAEAIAAPRCFVVRAPSGSVEQICESQDFVTVERVPVVAGAAPQTPPPEVLRAHALHQLQEAAGLAGGPALPAGSRPVTWAGLSIGAGPWGALPASGASGALGFAGRIGYAVAPQQASRVVFGLVLDQTYGPAAESAKTARAITSLAIRVGYGLTDRVLLYGLGGLATNTQRADPLGGAAVGLGLAYAIDDRWSVSLEYRYVEVKPDRTRTGIEAFLVPVAGTIGLHTLDARLEYKLL